MANDSFAVAGDMYEESEVKKAMIQYPQTESRAEKVVMSGQEDEHSRLQQCQ